MFLFNRAPSKPTKPTKHIYANIIQTWLDSLSPDITVLDFKECNLSNYSNITDYISPLQLTDFIFDVSRFEKLTYVYTNVYNIYLTSDLFQYRAIPLNLIFSPNANITHYYNSSLSLFESVYKIDLSISECTPEEKAAYLYLKTTIENLPKTITDLIIGTLHWSDAQNLPLPNLKQIHASHSICYDYKSFNERQINVYLGLNRQQRSKGFNIFDQNYQHHTTLEDTVSDVIKLKSMCEDMQRELVELKKLIAHKNNSIE